MTILAQFILASQIFPIRYAGVDTAVAGALLGLLVFWPRRVAGGSAVAALVAIALLGYTVLLMVFQTGLDLYVIGRHGRFAFSALAIALLVTAVPGGALTIVNAVRHGIHVHAAFVVLQIVVPGVRGVMAALLGVEGDRAFLAMRAFGLTGAYDTAGLMLCVGLLITIALFLEEPRTRYLLEASLIWGAGLLTGRTFWVAGSVLLLVMMGLALVRGRGAGRFVILGGALAGAVAIAIVLGPLLMLSLFPERFTGNNVALEETLRSAGYYSGTTTTLKESVRFPSGWLLLLGGGGNPEWTDFGYVKLLFMNGIVGMAMLAVIYFGAAFSSIVAVVSRVNVSALDIITAGTLLILLLFNIKMLAIGSRSVSELYFVVAFARLSYPGMVRLASRFDGRSRGVFVPRAS